MQNVIEEVRVDKWLWAARFFKTRSLATEAINGGKVHLNGQRIKPSRKLKVNDTLSISIGQVEKVVIVLGLSDRRGPASIAQSLYEETAESIQKREEKKQLMASQPQMDRFWGKPNKKDRRDIRKFKQTFD